MDNPKVGGSNPPPATNLIKSYLSEVALLRKPNTLREAKRICFAALPYLNQQDPRQGVLAYLTARKPQVTARTLENERIRLGAMYRTAGIKLDIPKFKFVQKSPEAYSDSEVSSLLQAASTDRDRLLYTTLWQAGLRMQEAMFLTFDDLLNTGIKICAHGEWSPKTSEERVVHVPRQLVENLRSLPHTNGTDLVFPTRTGTVNHHMIRWVKVAAKRAGLDPRKAWLHKFRGTFATTLLRRGISIREVMVQLGHSNIKSTMRYLALLGDDDLQAKIENVWK